MRAVTVGLLSSQLRPAHAGLSSASASNACSALREDVRDDGLQHLSLLQLRPRLEEELREVSNHSQVNQPLAFAHVPCNFGHTVENVGLGEGHNPFPIALSLAAPTYQEQLGIMEHLVKAPCGALWGMMHPAARPISAETGCNLYYTPGYMWPQEAAAEYFGSKQIFALLRDPLDKMVNEFRMQVEGVDSIYTMLTRAEISLREGHFEREGPEYMSWYWTCNVNAYLQSELKYFLQGGKQRYRGNCHLLPQSEYFKGAHGATIAVDVRKIPDSFNQLMEEHGYEVKMGTTMHNFMCNGVSAYSLTEETKALIRQVYAEDYALLCQKFGYCNDQELTCLSQIPDMCGGKPPFAP